MGSTGNGMFGMYSRGGAGAISDGTGDNGRGECPSVIENIRLEDVAISEYFVKHNNVPEVNQSVELAMKLINKRLAVVLSNTREVIGNLPVSYNYLNLCIKKGRRYSGEIKSSGVSPIPYIVVNLYA